LRLYGIGENAIVNGRKRRFSLSNLETGNVNKGERPFIRRGAGLRGEKGSKHRWGGGSHHPVRMKKRGGKT